MLEIPSRIKKTLTSTYYGALGALTGKKEYKVIAHIEESQSYQCIYPEKTDGQLLRKYLEKRSARRVNSDRIARIPTPQHMSVLDIGANLGYFGFTWASAVKSYVGVDNDHKTIRAAQALAQSRNKKNLSFIEADIYEYIKKAPKFDVCLFFSVYHHLFYADKDKARALLGDISKKCTVMYFDMGQINEEKNYPGRKWYAALPQKKPELFIKDEVLKHSTYTRCEIIGETTVGKCTRLLFKFT